MKKKSICNGLVEKALKGLDFTAYSEACVRMEIEEGEVRAPHSASLIFTDSDKL